MRDKIPEIIKADGRKCDTLIVAGDEKYKFLKAKLQEEVNEYSRVDKQIILSRETCWKETLGTRVPFGYNCN